MEAQEKNNRPDFSDMPITASVSLRTLSDAEGKRLHEEIGEFAVTSKDMAIKGAFTPEGDLVCQVFGSRPSTIRLPRAVWPVLALMLEQVLDALDEDSSEPAASLSITAEATQGGPDGEATR